MRVRIHPQDAAHEREIAASRAGAAELDRLIQGHAAPEQFLVCYTAGAASLMLKPGVDALFPEDDFPVIEFLKALKVLPRGPRAGAAIIAAGGFDRIAVAAGSAAEAEVSAHAIAGTLAPLEPRASADDIRERLSGAARIAALLVSQKRIHAAAIGLRGRGRIAGPVNPDLLIRFGVSAFL